MASLKESGMGIGDFAQHLLQSEASTPSPKKAPTVKGDSLDISEVVVSQESVNQVLSESFGISDKQEPKVDLEEQRRQQIKEEIRATVKKLKSLLNQLPLDEITTVGNLGVNMTTVTDGKHKKRYKATSRRKIS